jgi:hypothetical protein
MKAEAVKGMRKNQQGDVAIYKVAGPAKGKRLDHLILAEGEVTGHCHKVIGDAALFENVDGLMLEVFSGIAEVDHYDHGNLLLEPGVYKVGKIQEYDHFKEEARKVAD